MSTVLWANQLLDGKVTSDQSDKYALCKHLKKLDAICKDHGLSPLSGFCDDTDLRVNLGREELPEGMQSTDELMARSGTWIDGGQAASVLGKLLESVRAGKVRFGLLSNDHEAVVAELEESLAFATQAGDKGARFNFSVVM